MSTKPSRRPPKGLSGRPSHAASAASRVAATPESTTATFGVPTARELKFRDQAGIRLSRKTSSRRWR
jgi:hypothetical protein